MFSLCPRAFRSLLIAPALFPLLFMSKTGGSLTDWRAFTDTNYAVHAVLYGTFPFNDPIRLVSTGQVSHGTLRTFGQFNGFSQDSFIYEPNTGYVGADSFTYHACDSLGNCDDGTINLDVVNSAPDAVDDSYAVHRILYAGGDTPLTVNDSDADHDPIRIVSVTAASHGRFSYSFSTDSFIYEPNLGFTGTDTATYKICDSLGLCDTATISFNVVNHSPVANRDNYKTRRNEALSADGPDSLIANDSDSDSDSFSVTAYSAPSSGTLTFSSSAGAFTYQPNLDYVGQDSFVYTICDDLGACANGTVVIDVEGPTPTPTPTPLPTATPTPPPPPLPPPSPTPTPTPLEPLIFIPGISGSRLDERLSSGGRKNLWPGFSSLVPLIVSDKSRLTLDPGQPHADIFAPDIIRSVPARVLGMTVAESDVYGTLIQRLVQNGYKEYQVNGDPNRRTSAGCDLSQKSEAPNGNPNLFIFAYDWRQSNADTSAALRSYVDCVKQFYPDSEVNILTHSMGGLLARRYILENPNGTHDVNKLITIAAPWLGAPKAINVLETGQFGVPETIVKEETLRTLVKFFKSAHEILPDGSYFSLAGSPFGEKNWDINGDRRVDQSYTYDQFVSLLDNVRFKESRPGTTNRMFHISGQDDWRTDSSGVKYFHFYGNQRYAATIGKLVGISRPQCDSAGMNCKTVNEFMKTYVRGDGTVPVASAERAANGVNLNAPSAVVRAFTNPSADVEHTALTQNSAVFAAILSALNSESQAQLKEFVPSSDKHVRAHHGYRARSSARKSSQLAQPVSDPAQYLTVWGVDHVIVEDSLGNRNDPIPGTGIGDHLPEVTYDLGLNSVSLVMPTDQSYTLTFESKGEPIFLELVTGTNNETPTNAIRYLDLNLPAEMSALLRITPSGVEDLRYDADGDGMFETTVTPTVSLNGALAADVTPPTVTISGEPEETKVRVTISAQDSESGLGILRYSLDGTHYQLYTGPFVVDPLQTPAAYAFADDLAANRSGLISYDVPQPPTITAPENVTVNTEPYVSGCGVTLSDNALGNPTAISNSQGTVLVTRTGVPTDNVFPVGTTAITYTARDSNGLMAIVTQDVTVIDKTPPTLTRPGNILVLLPFNSTATSTVVNYSVPTATDNCSGPVAVNSVPVSGSIFPVGTLTVVATATDAAGNSSSTSFTVTVMYNFGGFFPPVNNLPVLNSVNAGRAIPIKFSLAGNRGLSVFALVLNNPGSGPVACDSTAAEIDLTETLAAGNSSLSYDSQNDQYTYVWKTDSSWAGTCRQFVIQLNDGSVHRANFRFK